MSRPVIRRWRLLVLLLLPVLPLCAPPARAAEDCTQHHPDGVAPSITRPALERDTSRLCFEGFAVLYSGVSRTPLAVSEHLTRDRIQQAKEDWRAGRFPLIPGDAEEFIPMPEVAKTVSYP